MFYRIKRDIFFPKFVKGQCKKFVIKYSEPRLLLEKLFELFFRFLIKIMEYK